MATDYDEITLKSWDQIREFEVEYPTRIFRGQSNCDWALSTALERCLRRFGQEQEYWVNNEWWMIHEFRRKAHLYQANLPAANDTISWLGLMQHHGAPTRLLDFTYSFYVACYFALIDADGDSAIWMLDDAWLRERCGLLTVSDRTILDKMKDDQAEGFNVFAKDYLDTLYLRAKENQDEADVVTATIISVEPHQQTARSAIQQGIFLMPTEIRKTFMQNIVDTELDPALPEGERERLSNTVKYVKKVIIPIRLRANFLAHLKAMNITAETLFPGIDGLARSVVHTEVAI